MEQSEGIEHPLHMGISIFVFCCMMEQKAEVSDLHEKRDHPGEGY